MENTEGRGDVCIAWVEGGGAWWNLGHGCHGKVLQFDSNVYEWMLNVFIHMHRNDINYYFGFYKYLFYNFVDNRIEGS